MKSLRVDANPILVKELRSRMRGGRAFAVLTAVLLILGVFSYALFRLIVATADYNPAPISPQVGQVLFAGLAFLELSLIVAITPTLTAGAISDEKEKLTYEMLLATPLHPARILSGKLVAALSYVFLLIFAAIPLVSLVFLFGGVALRDILKALIVLGFTAITIGVLGLFFSALFGRSGRATITTYLIVVLSIFGPLLVSMSYNLLNPSLQAPRWLQVPNPVGALASAIAPSINSQTIASRFWMFYGPWSSFNSPPISLVSIPRPLYHYTLPVYGAITLVLYLLATRLVLPVRRWRIHWSEFLLGLALILGYIALVGAGFYATTHRYENIQILPATSPSQSGQNVPVPQEKGNLPTTRDRPIANMNSWYAANLFIPPECQITLTTVHEQGMDRNARTSTIYLSQVTVSSPISSQTKTNDCSSENPRSSRGILI